MKRFSCRGGTVLELVIASAITLIVGLSLFGAIHSGRTAWQSGAALVEACRNASGALDVMQREISSMFIFPPSAGFRDTGLFYGDNGEGTREFRFYALITDQSGDWDLCRVGYRHVPETGEIQRLFNVDPHEEKDMIWHPFAEGIDSLEFYLYTGEDNARYVFDYWDTFSEDARQRGKIPGSVEIAIAARDNGGFTEKREFSILVSVPAGNREVFIGADDNF